MPAPPPSPTGARAPAGAVGVGLGAGLGLWALIGVTPPLSWGAAPAIAGLLLAAALGSWRARTLRHWTVDGTAAALAGLPRARRWIAATLVVLPTVIVVASAARAIAGLCVASPPAIAGLAVLVGAALVPARRTGSAIALGAVTAGVAVAIAVVAARFEAAGPGARGFAHGGPILGIHPFQTTAILIDGYGPFDLPINDYVEPDGSKGYGPEALAEALQRDLAAIAEQQFSDGPARAYQAFAAARVEAVTLPAQQERLDRPVEGAASEPHLVVWSGTTGRGSRVEFVCPGARNDPRPREADAVMERMCPDKYSAEASAGLGLTGRWTGYTEGRGLARLDLTRVLGWSRTDDAPGARTLLWERRLWAWIALLLAGALALRPALVTGLARGAGGLAVSAAAVLVAMVVWTCPTVQVGWFARAAAWRSPWVVSAWGPALALALACAAGGLAGAQGSRPRRPVPLAGRLLAAAIVCASWAVSGELGALTWARPGPDAGLEDLALGLGGALHRGLAIDLPAAEAIAATALLAGLLALLAGALGPVLQLAGGLLRPGGARRGGPVLVSVVVVLAGLLVLSRKTLGGAALLTPALALALAACSGLASQVPGRGRWLRALDHGVAVGLVMGTIGQAWAARGNGMMAAALVLGVLAGLASLALLQRPTAVRSAVDGP